MKLSQFIQILQKEHNGKIIIINLKRKIKDKGKRKLKKKIKVIFW